jgi:peroxiredoxin
VARENTMSESSKSSGKAPSPPRGSVSPGKPHTTSGPPHLLPAGTPAPDFLLPSTPDQKVSLKELRGRPVILAFYPADWSPVCSDQMGVYNEILGEFEKYNAEIMGISVDGIWSHGAFSRDRKLHFPLLSDFEPKGEVSRRYGAYMDQEGESARALFVVDAKGVIQWSYLSPTGINPGANGILAALERLSKPGPSK